MSSSVLGLEKHHSVAEKIGLTSFLLLLLGLLLAFVFLAAVFQAEGLPWEFAFHAFLRAVGIFYCVLLVFIWWRPSWLRRHYVRGEQALVRSIAWFFVTL